MVSKLLHLYPFLEIDPFGASGDTAPTPAARNYFPFYPPSENLGLLGTLPSPLQLETPFPLPSMKKQSWALEGNFRAWQLKGQIARFGPAARND